MSAAEVIEMIKELPSPEREEVVDFVRTTYSEDDSADGVRYAESAQVRPVLAGVMEQYAPLFRKLAE